MAEQPPKRIARLIGRATKFPSERDWSGAVQLTPRIAAADPELVSDGAGPPFPPSALQAPDGGLDVSDSAVAALIAQLASQAGSINASAWSAEDGGPAEAADSRHASLAGWRLLARNDEEALFGRGCPPQLLTVTMRLDTKRGTWRCVAANTNAPLRSTRDGIRASRWRLDPARAPDPEDTFVRVLVTEQTYAGGKRADDRLLSPDMFLDPETLVLTVFITPRPGFQTRSRNPETLAQIMLPGPIGHRRILDGSLYPRPVAPPDGGLPS